MAEIRNKFHKNAGVIYKPSSALNRERLGIVLCHDGDPECVWVRFEVNEAIRVHVSKLTLCKKPKELVNKIEEAERGED